jgi:beta-lactamase superfamily II metal-dependent hydrolase
MKVSAYRSVMASSLWMQRSRRDRASVRTDIVNYDGLEIDMLYVGRADCILVTKWYGSWATRVLIDGGNKGSVDEIRDFLVRRGATYIDHVVCSHPHDDHASGLVELVKDEDLHFGKAWVHKPNEHVDRGAMDLALSKRASLKRPQVVLKSLRTADALLTALDARGVPVEEPFENKNIGFLEVCGPSEEYYQQLLEEFTYPDGILNDAIYHALVDILEGSKALKSSSTPTLEVDPVTTPENNSSAILRAEHDGGIYLFTADAGAEALERASGRHDLGESRWMQIPHHGSRSNITEELIEHFGPSSAFVSADGSEKHPSPAVVNAVKEAGAWVYGTHYPTRGHLRKAAGNVPNRPGYGVASPL